MSFKSIKIDTFVNKFNPLMQKMKIWNLDGLSFQNYVKEINK